MTPGELLLGEAEPAAAEIVPAAAGAIAGILVPVLFAPNARTARRFAEFFGAHIRNANTRRAYLGAVASFSAWCETRGWNDLSRLQPLHVAKYIEELQGSLSPPSIKQHLAALRMLFDWLVLGQVLGSNPASVVRGPKYSAKRGKTPVLSSEEARELLASIEAASYIGRRDRALIGTMAYTFARVGAAVQVWVEDVYMQRRRMWIRLHEKGGKRHELPCHHKLEELLDVYLETTGWRKEPKGFLFRTVDWVSGEPTARPLSQADAHRMVRRQAADAGLETKIGNHTFRATGITAYLQNGGRLEVAQQMAAHESSRTTGLYDRRGDEVDIEEVERIGI